MVTGQVVSRGDVFLVNFDPTMGAEIKKTRPALILQNNVSNKYSPVTIVAAITTFDHGELYPTDVLVHAREAGLSKDSIVLLNQIRTIDKKRLVKKLGRVMDQTLGKVNMAVEISLGLFDI